MAETAIEWATHVWNPVTGCSRVSPGCAHCYALTYAGRLKAMGQPKYQRDGGRGSGRGFGVTLHPSELDAPAHWRKPRRVFVNSMSDLFHEAVPDDFIAAVWTAMARAEQHTFLVLTKRPERMAALVPDLAIRDGAPLPNVWLGVSIENRRFVGRADLLRATPAAVRFISAEPLLGPLVPHGRSYDDTKWGWYTARHFGSEWNDDPGLDLTGIDWLIVGGESGPGHRPMRPEWARDLRDACIREGLAREDRSLAARAPDARPGPAFFFKQWGGNSPKAGGRELDGHTWDELPALAREAVAA